MVTFSRYEFYNLLFLQNTQKSTKMIDVLTIIILTSQKLTKKRVKLVTIIIIIEPRL